MPEPFERAWARSVRRDAETVERVGDRIGANRTDLANHAYHLAGYLREWAREIEDRIPRSPEPTDQGDGRLSDEDLREQALKRYLRDQACYRDDNRAAFLAGWDHARASYPTVLDHTEGSEA